MRQLTEQEQAKLKALTSYSVSLTLIEPTRTGLEKSIMDATGPVRQYLLDTKFHNFQDQGQGKEHKVFVDAVLVSEFAVQSSLASLYRPKTKKGDPRIWFTNLKRYASSNDILALLTMDHKIYVLNLTRLPVVRLLASPIANPLKELAEAIRGTEGAIAQELLRLLRRIAAQGPIRAELAADTAVGRTLETLLGIPINSSRNPDYKGIELKSFRDARSNRKNLFAKVPDWELSKFKSSREILNAFGYTSGQDFKLYCTVSTRKPNSQGLSFHINATARLLHEKSERREIGDFAAWSLSGLHERLLMKHNETFWIAAESSIVDGEEYFRYVRAEHTRKPIASQFDVLLEQGVITMDHQVKRSSSGRLSEKGPEFKIDHKKMNLLFPPSTVYDLL